MKKYLTIIILTLFFGSELQAQRLVAVKAAKIRHNSGKWFLFHDKDYHPTVEDAVLIASSVDIMQTGMTYQLPNGEQFVPFYPKKWSAMMTRIIKKVKMSVEGTSMTTLPEELAKCRVVSWDDVSVTTNNWGIDESGTAFIASKDYNGRSGYDAFNYDGYPILKTYPSCLNCNDPEIIPLRGRPAVTEPPVSIRRDNVLFSTPKDDNVTFSNPKDGNVTFYPPAEQKKDTTVKRKFVIPQGVLWGLRIIGTARLAQLAVIYFRKEKGGPGGAPETTLPITPITPTPVTPGGPGGAPSSPLTRSVVLSNFAVSVGPINYTKVDRIGHQSSATGFGVSFHLNIR